MRYNSVRSYILENDGKMPDVLSSQVMLVILSVQTSHKYIEPAAVGAPRMFSYFFSCIAGVNNKLCNQHTKP